MNAYLNLYIRREKLKFGKPPGKILGIYRFLVEIWRFLSPLEKFSKIYRFLVKIGDF